MSDETYTCSKCGFELPIPSDQLEAQMERLEALDRVAEDCRFEDLYPTFEAKAARLRWSRLMDGCKDFEQRFNL